MIAANFYYFAINWSHYSQRFWMIFLIWLEVSFQRFVFVQEFGERRLNRGFRYLSFFFG